MWLLASTLSFAIEPIRVHPSTMESAAFARLVVPDELRGALALDPDRFAERATRRLAALDYDVRGDVDQDLFSDKDEGHEARYQVGGLVTEVACRTDVWPYGCEVAVRWQVYDNRSRLIVYEADTRGLARATESDGLAEKALDLSLTSLLTRQSFVDAQTKLPDPGDPPPNWRGELAVRRCAAPSRTLPTDLPKMLDAVVLVGTDDRIGSGVMISPDGFATTAAHVVHGERSVGVAFHDGRLLEARVLRIDEGQDVAIIKVDGTAFPCAAPASSPPPLGADLFAIGFPLGFGLEWSVSRGIVSGTRVWEDHHFIQTDAAINHGNSGGPLFDKSGRIAGIVTFKVDLLGVEGLAFGVPEDALVDRLDLVFSDASDPDPIARVGERAVTPERRRFVDAEDPSFIYTVPTAMKPTEPVFAPVTSTGRRR